MGPISIQASGLQKSRSTNDHNCDVNLTHQHNSYEKNHISVQTSGPRKSRSTTDVNLLYQHNSSLFAKGARICSSFRSSQIYDPTDVNLRQKHNSYLVVNGGLYLFKLHCLSTVTALTETEFVRGWSNIILGFRDILPTRSSGNYLCLCWFCGSKLHNPSKCSTRNIECNTCKTRHWTEACRSIQNQRVIIVVNSLIFIQHYCTRIIAATVACQATIFEL